MSRPRVITGTDDRGRPKAAWADPEPDRARGYGHMEPAYDVASVQRRQATPEELAAARAREAEPSHLTTDNAKTLPFGAMGAPDAERMQASRQRGAERHVEVVAARRAQRDPSSEEDPAMPEPQPLDTFQTLSEAATTASEAWARRQAAETAWAIAQEALEAALGEVDELLHPPLLPPILVAAAAPDEPDPKPTIDRSTSRSGEGQRPGQAAARDRRAAAVMAAMERHGGDQKAAAAELGMKTNALVMVVKHARKRAGVTA